MSDSQPEVGCGLTAGGPGEGRRCCGRRHGGGVGRGTLVEPAAIAALLAGGSHGYDMRRAILEMTHGEVDVDTGGLYRVLRRLETEGSVTSEWFDETAGPRRRDYELTPSGRELAGDWIAHLRERERLAGLLAQLLEAALTEQAPSPRNERPRAANGRQGELTP